MNELFSSVSVHTVSGGGLAVMLIVQVAKQWATMRLIPTQLLSMIVGELLVVLTSPLQHSVSGWVVLVLNGILISSTAIGGWHLINSSKGGL